MRAPELKAYGLRGFKSKMFTARTKSMCRSLTKVSVREIQMKHVDYCAVS